MVEQPFRWIGDQPPEIPVFAFRHRPILVAQQQCGSRVLWVSAEMEPSPCEVGWCMSISRVGRSRSPATLTWCSFPPGSTQFWANHATRCSHSRRVRQCFATNGAGMARSQSPVTSRKRRRMSGSTRSTKLGTACVGK
jgi:hypothetical protein